MPYNFICSTKILTLAMALFLFILVGAFCEFAMVLGEYILLSSQEEEVHFSSWGHKCTHSAANSSKDLNPCLPLYCHPKVIVELEKIQTRNSAVLWCL